MLTNTFWQSKNTGFPLPPKKPGQSCVHALHRFLLRTRDVRAWHGHCQAMSWISWKLLGVMPSWRSIPRSVLPRCAPLELILSPLSKTPTCPSQSQRRSPWCELSVLSLEPLVTAALAQDGRRSFGILKLYLTAFIALWRSRVIVHEDWDGLGMIFERFNSLMLNHLQTNLTNSKRYQNIHRISQTL